MEFIISLTTILNLTLTNYNYKISQLLLLTKLSFQTKPPQKFLIPIKARDTMTNRTQKISPIPSLCSQEFPNCSSKSRDATKMIQTLRSEFFERKKSRYDQRRKTLPFRSTWSPDRSKLLFTPKLFPLVETLAPWAGTMKILVMPCSPLPTTIPFQIEEAATFCHAF